MRTRRVRLGLLAAAVLVVMVGYVVGTSTAVYRVALAQGSGQDAMARATKAQPNRDAYFPNTEDLTPDEMRIIACGNR